MHPNLLGDMPLLPDVAALELWLAVQSPMVLLALGFIAGMLTSLVLFHIFEAVCRRLDHVNGKWRCFFGLHDDDHVECMDAWHCWSCGRRTPDHVVALIAARNQRP